MRVGLAALVFLPSLRNPRAIAATIAPVYAGRAMQLGIMYLLAFRAPSVPDGV